TASDRRWTNGRRDGARPVPEGGDGAEEGARSGWGEVPVSGKLQTVHVRVNDAATGQPTPVRIRFTDASGCYYPPFGRLPESHIGLVECEGSVLIDGRAYAYIDGTCEINLPPGPIRVEVHKG